MSRSFPTLSRPVVIMPPIISFRPAAPATPGILPGEGVRLRRGPAAQLQQQEPAAAATALLRRATAQLQQQEQPEATGTVHINPKFSLVRINFL